MPAYIKELTDILDSNQILSDTQTLQQYSIDGKNPKLVLFPNTIEETSEILKIANLHNLAIVPRGGGTKIGFGNEPNSVDIVLCIKNLNRLINHDVDDLIATTQCGIKLKEFQKIIKEKNQTLPIDPPHIERGATIGGIIATNDSGPKRLRSGTTHGTLREVFLGLKVIRPDGKIVKGGSRVVKSVAGYDLPKLFIGSLGTLGIIVEATLRLFPIPEFSQTYLVSFQRLEAAYETVLSILNSSLIPTCLEMINPNLINIISNKLNLNIKRREYSLAIRMENVAKAVKSQTSKLKEICLDKGSEGMILEDDLEEEFWHEVREFPWLDPENERAVCRVSVLITDVPKVFWKLEDLANNPGIEILASARAGNGILIIALKSDTTRLTEAIISMRSFVDSLKGNMVIQKAPSIIKSKIDVWGDIGSPLSIMKRLKYQFDPNRILNPGRYVGGI